MPEGFDLTLTGVRNLFSNEEKMVKNSVICQLVEDEKAIRITQMEAELDAIHAAKVGLEMDLVEAQVTEAEIIATVKATFAVQFAELEKARLQLQAQYDRSEAAATKEIRKTMAVINAQIDRLCKQSESIEDELKNPSSGVPCCG